MTTFVNGRQCARHARRWLGVPRNVLVLAWTVALLAGEWLVFSVELAKCVDTGEAADLRGGAATRLAIVADPQLTDAYSYRQKAGTLLSLTQFYSDLYMRRAFSALMSTWPPDGGVLFLGDLFDGGREWDDAEIFKTELQRFHGVFPKTDEVPRYFVSGNHDIGFGNAIVVKARERFRTTFGKLNYVVPMAGHVLVIIDTIALSADLKPEVQREGLAFLEEVERTDRELQQQNKVPPPRILFTHVPLYRPADMTQDMCNRSVSYRNHPSDIAQGTGYQYQNVIDEPLTRRVLETVKPIAVFSGDDHDQCLYYHELADGRRVPEYTVGTFSWLQGNTRPSYAQLYLSPAGTATVNICFMPSQLHIYYSYIALFIVTLLVLGWPVLSLVCSSRSGRLSDDYNQLGNHERGLLKRTSSRTSLRGDLPMSTKDVAIADMEAVTLLQLRVRQAVRDLVYILAFGFGAYAALLVLN